MNRLEVRELVLLCTNCDLCKNVTAPVPFHGPTPSRLAILGEAPGATEDQAGRPFCGAAGKLLWKMLAKAGIEMDDCVLLNTTSCWPRRVDGRGRAPTPEEVKSCSANREAQLALADSRFVILTGNVPLQAYRPDLKISKVRGRLFFKTPGDYASPLFFPVFHPAAVLRNPSWERVVGQDLELLAEVLDNSRSLTNQQLLVRFAPASCVACGALEGEMDSWHCDDQGLPYCQDHFPSP